MKKIPILVELIGETAVGKTHTGLLFPKPLLLDCTPEREGEVIAMKVFGVGGMERYEPVESYNDVNGIVNRINKNDDIGVKTFVIDTSNDFKNIVAGEWKRTHDKDSVYPVYLWGDVYNMMDDLVKKMMLSPANVVFTSGMKAKYRDDNVVGRMRDGYTRLPGQCWLRLYIDIEDGKRIFKVAKNRFIDEIDAKYVRKFTSEDFDDLFDKVVDMTFGLAGLPEEMVVK